MTSHRDFVAEYLQDQGFMTDVNDHALVRTFEGAHAVLSGRSLSEALASVEKEPEQVAVVWTRPRDTMSTSDWHVTMRAKDFIAMMRELGLAKVTLGSDTADNYRSPERWGRRGL